MSLPLSLTWTPLPPGGLSVSDAGSALRSGAGDVAIFVTVETGIACGFVVTARTGVVVPSVTGALGITSCTEVGARAAFVEPPRWAPGRVGCSGLNTIRL